MSLLLIIMSPKSLHLTVVLLSVAINLLSIHLFVASFAYKFFNSLML